MPTRGGDQVGIDPWDKMRDCIKYMKDDAEANFQSEKVLRERLMPATLSQGKTYDLPDDLGVAGLFDTDE